MMSPIRLLLLPFLVLLTPALADRAAEPTVRPPAAASVSPPDSLKTTASQIPPLADLKSTPYNPDKRTLSLAAERLLKWQKERAVPCNRKLRVVYYTPSDREPQADYVNRLTRVMKHVQEFYASQFTRYGFEKSKLALDLDAAGNLKIILVRGVTKNQDFTFAKRDEHNGAMKNDITDEMLRQGFNADKETVLVFNNLVDYDPVNQTTNLRSPYSGEGSSLRGWCWQVDSAILDPQLLGEKSRFVTDGEYRKISLGEYNSIFIGGVAHELGHALGLPHSKQSVLDQGRNLMGNGNRTYFEELRGEGLGTFMSSADVLKLLPHPLFSGSSKQADLKIKASFASLTAETLPEGLRVSGKIETNVPVFAVLAYAAPEGRKGGYDRENSSAIPDSAGKFSLLLPHPDKRRNCKAVIQLVGVAMNGSATAGVSSQAGYAIEASVDDRGRLVAEKVPAPGRP